MNLNPFRYFRAPSRETTQEVMRTLLWAGAAALLIRTFLFAPFMIPSGSMRPTLIEGDRILVNKIVYGVRVPFTGQRLLKFSKPRRGDIIVFRSPDKTKDYIKRLVAVGGDTLEIKNARLWVNGRPVDDPPIFLERVYYNRGAFGRAGQPFHVPEGELFFMGDNSGSSKDSRYFGSVSERHVVGRTFLIMWPLKRIRYFR